MWHAWDEYGESEDEYSEDEDESGEAAEQVADEPAGEGEKYRMS